MVRCRLSVVERGKLKADDLLFGEHHRDGFRELLEAAGLRKDTYGNVRNLKALRSTGLMMRIKANPRINLKLLAENAGTSVTMLDTFYLKRLSVDMGVEELVWSLRRSHLVAASLRASSLKRRIASVEIE